MGHTQGPALEPDSKPARPADAAPIAQMSRRLIERGLAWRWTPKAVAARIPDSETTAVVARTDRRMVGFAIMSFRFSRELGANASRARVSR